MSLKAFLKTAERHSISHQYDNIEGMLEGADFDLLVNLTDIQEHTRLNRQALEKGRPIWSEKPLANSCKEGRYSLDLLITKGLKFWSAPMVVNSLQSTFMSRTI